METIVFYNAGKAAKVKGEERLAPDHYDYPIVSRYQTYRTERVALCKELKKAWYEGFDGKYERKTA